MPIPSMTVDALKQHQREQTKARLKAGKWPELNLVFCTARGGPISPGNLGTRFFKPLLDKAELPDSLTLYSLRHSFVTLALAGGVSPKTVSEWAGHASVAFTLDVYSHLIPSMVSAGTAQLEATFSKILNPEKKEQAKESPVIQD